MFIVQCDTRVAACERAGESMMPIARAGAVDAKFGNVDLVLMGFDLMGI